MSVTDGSHHEERMELTRKLNEAAEREKTAQGRPPMKGDDSHPPSPTASNASLYMTYMRGWCAGAGRNVIDKRCEEHADERIREAYRDGWAAGRTCSRDAAREAEKLYGYAPSILRLQDVQGS